MRSQTLITASGLTLGTVLLAASSASAALYPLTWLDMSPTPVGSSVPNNSVFNMPGVGNVTLSYSLSGNLVDNRGTSPFMQNGSVTSGSDTYSWGPHETFGVTNLGNSASAWSITYTFSNPQPAGSIYLGVLGLGRTSSFGGGMSTATVLQNGTFLGDWSGGGNYGATQFTGGPGTFQMNNSVTGAGGIDPWWNTQLGVVRIDDPISSLTVNFSQLAGDGVGVNIAAVPTPGAAALVGIGGMIGTARRRR